MTDDEMRTHLDELTEVQKMQQRNEADRAKAKRLTAWAVIIACLCVLASLVVVGAVLRDKTTTDTTNGQKITELTDELRAARKLIESNDATIKAKDSCVQSFSSTISVRLSDYLATLGDLVVVAVSADADRAAEIAAKIEQLRTDLVRYRAAVKDRNDWDQAGSPLPCPLS